MYVYKESFNKTFPYFFKCICVNVFMYIENVKHKRYIKFNQLAILNN